MKFLPEQLGDERLIRVFDYPEAEIVDDIGLIASMRFRTGVPIEKVLISEPAYRRARERQRTPQGEPLRLPHGGGWIDVGIDPDDPATPLPPDEDNPHRP